MIIASVIEEKIGAFGPKIKLHFEAEQNAIKYTKKA
jgi:hypothetical protein